MKMPTKSGGKKPSKNRNQDYKPAVGGKSNGNSSKGK